MVSVEANQPQTGRTIFDVFGAGFSTDAGFGRQTNEDAPWAASRTGIVNPSGRLLAVADGMGGHKGGGYANQYTCNALGGYVRKRPSSLNMRQARQSLSLGFNIPDWPGIHQSIVNSF